MKQFLLFIGVILLGLAACQSSEKETDTISKEHLNLIGTWQEVDSTDSTIWKFNRYEVKWRGFSHFYKVSGDSLIISGMVHKILNQTDSTMKIMKLNGKQCTLNRKK